VVSRVVAVNVRIASNNLRKVGNKITNSHVRRSVVFLETHISFSRE